MDNSFIEPICRHEFEAQKLASDFPPRITVVKLEDDLSKH